MASMGDPDARPIIRIIAGPNGAGKSTLYHTRIRRVTKAPFINADEIERQCRERGEPLADSYVAARLAAQQRDEFIRQRKSFVCETVFSHPSKLELIKRARQAGFYVELSHVHVHSPDISVHRVGQRVREGGHDVPEPKIRERHARNQKIIREAARMADITQVFDNSVYGQPHRWIMTLEQNKAVRAVLDLPDWARSLYADAFTPAR